MAKEKWTSNDAIHAVSSDVYIGWTDLDEKSVKKSFLPVGTRRLALPIARMSPQKSGVFSPFP
jgi:hypothetical protein